MFSVIVCTACVCVSYQCVSVIVIISLWGPEKLLKTIISSPNKETVLEFADGAVIRICLPKPICV